MASSRSLGTLTLDLIAKTGGWTTGLSKAERELDSRTKRMNKMAADFGRAIGLGFTAAAGAATAAMGIYIKNTIEAEKVQAQLTARIKDTGGVAQRTLEQLNEQAEQLSSITIFDDEAIGSAQAMLLTFKDIQGIQFDRAVESVLDLSTAMGTDLNSAALQVGKALNDPVKGIGALSRAGVQFSEDQKKLIKSLVEAGDKAGAQKIILAELEGQMGSAAEAAGSTFSGALQRLKNSFDNLLEGDSGSDGMLAAKAATEDLIKTLNDPDLKSGVDSLVGLFASLASEIGNGVARLVEFAREAKNTISISNKGGNFASYSDDEIATQQSTIAALISDARKSGNKEFVDALRKDFTALQREETKRLKAAAGDAAKLRNLDPKFGLFVPERPQSTTSADTRSGRGSRGGSSRRERPDFTDEDAKALRELVDETVKAYGAFDQLEATLSGPLAEAELDHKRRLEEIVEVGTKAGKSSEDISRLKQLETKRYQEETEAIRARKEPIDQLLEDLKFEAELLGLTADQQEVLNNLRSVGIDVNNKYAESIRKATEDLQQQREKSRDQIEAMDALRDAGRGLFDDLKEGVGIWDSLKNAVHRFSDALFDIASKNIIESIFGQYGSDGKGTPGGGWIGQILGSFFGGGQATGGQVVPGMMYRVNEQGPELLSVNGSDYLMMGSQNGRITSNHLINPSDITFPEGEFSGDGMSVYQENQFVFSAPTSPKTQTQLAAKTGFQIRQAQRLRK